MRAERGRSHGNRRRADRSPKSCCFALVLALLLVVVPSGPARAAGAAEPPTPLILISIDGFRWDYLDLYAAPHLRALAATGLQAASLVPVFPSKTFPNHYTAVTGLYPQHHGIVDNAMVDAKLGRFSLGDRSAVEDGRWWGGEPVWVTAEKQGLRSATCFWPGSEAEIAGVRPSYWRRYDSGFPDEDRVALVFEWLDLPPDRRPSFLTLYFSKVDSAGHDRGPDDPATAAAVAATDRVIGTLVAGLEERGLYDRVHLLVISDHGMAATPPDQTLYLSDYVDLGGVEISGGSPMLALRPRDERTDEMLTALRKAHPRLHAMRREDTPTVWHYRDSPRIPPLLVMADEGWNLRTSRPWPDPPRGMHGYDPGLASMRGILIGHGPRLSGGRRTGSIEMVDLYALMCRLLGLDAAPNDGHPEAVDALLGAP